MSMTDGFMQRSARRWLGQLHDDIGAAGLAAAAALPGLAAAIDQHAAAIRDSITPGMEGSASLAGLVLLASYGRGVLEYAHERGWRPPTGGAHNWVHADWTSLRLAAVCALAPAAGQPAPQLPPLDPPHQHAG